VLLGGGEVKPSSSFLLVGRVLTGEAVGVSWIGSQGIITVWAARVSQYGKLPPLTAFFQTILIVGSLLDHSTKVGQASSSQVILECLREANHVIISLEGRKRRYQPCNFKLCARSWSSRWFRSVLPDEGEIYFDIPFPYSGSEDKAMVVNVGYNFFIK
ncbi:hypothetical protein TNIN_20781, partial [Trichonephila inaurata madagascariensis]